MDYQLQTTKIVCANVGPRNKKRFLNPPMGDMPITEKMVGSPLARRNKHV